MKRLVFKEVLILSKLEKAAKEGEVRRVDQSADGRE
jgi:hypothetical protein